MEQSEKHMLLEKPLSKIPINDIAGDCGINRMAFSYRFMEVRSMGRPS